MQTIPADLRDDFVRLLLSVADDKLLLGHRNSDWTGLAPILEEDIAFSALAQDEIAHAQALYGLAASVSHPDARAGADASGDAPAADALAFGRPAAAYLCAAFVEADDGFDWAVALVRRFLCDAFDAARLQRLSGSGFAPLAHLAARLLREERSHLEHASGWLVRLGRGTTESAARMQAALDRLAPAAMTLFEPFDGEDRVASAGLYPGDRATMFRTWRAAVEPVLARAGLTAAFTLDPDPPRGGRRGVHSPAFSAQLDEMCEVFRLAPEAAW
ncbi:MAG: phenylacetate-CoA oxygenase subunit PaaC [Phycisphaeraceae bacterium]|nr:phenylacetate-CoA oxygenase subunit PaaC [Phycisphaeraceae bacterium]